MFYENVKELCRENRTNITSLMKELSMSTSMPTSWKKGAVPKADTVQKIADHFGVSVDYLLRDEFSPSFNIAGNISNSAVMQGNANGPVSISNSGAPARNELTDQESEVLRIFRALDMRLKNTVLTYLYEIEDQAKEKETKSGK